MLPPWDICCGRPLYDQGMLARAKWRLADAMEVLGPFAAAGIPIVGLEPSCILTFRDELPSFFPGEKSASDLAAHSMLLDEFIVRQAPDFVQPEIRGIVIVQGHCHQQTLAEIEHEVSLLSRVVALKV